MESTAASAALALDENVPVVNRVTGKKVRSHCKLTHYLHICTDIRFKSAAVETSK